MLAIYGEFCYAIFTAAVKMSKGDYIDIDKVKKQGDHGEKGENGVVHPASAELTWVERAFPGGYLPEFKRTISIAWAMVSDVYMVTGRSP